MFWKLGFGSYVRLDSEIRLGSKTRLGFRC